MAQPTGPSGVDEFAPWAASTISDGVSDSWGGSGGRVLEGTVPAARAITVRDLLTFRLGLGFGAGMWGPPGSVPIMDALGALGQGAPAPAGVPEPDEWMRQLGALPLAYQPGERWLYNLGSDVLGVLIAAILSRYTQWRDNGAGEGEATVRSSEWS
jgi:hypothetical protein